MYADNLRLISHTNTQVRNLVVARQLLLMIGNRSLPISLLKNEAIEWSKERYDTDEKYKTHNGALTNDKAQPTTAFSFYVSLLQSLGLVSRINEMIRLSKYGKIYQKIQEDIPIESSELTTLDFYFFFYFLLRADADNILLIMDQLYKHNSLSYEDIQEGYKEALKYRLMQKRETSSMRVKELIWDKFRIIEQEWQRAEKYSYHIVPPRIEWLIDFGLVKQIEGRPTKFELTNSGTSFLSKLNESKIGIIHDIDNDWIEARLMKSVRNSIKQKTQELVGLQLDFPGGYLEKSFDTFHDDEAFRLSTLPTLLYITLLYNISHPKSIEIRDILNILIDSDVVFNNKKYSLREAKRINESYINVRLV